MDEDSRPPGSKDERKFLHKYRKIHANNPLRFANSVSPSTFTDWSFLPPELRYIVNRGVGLALPGLGGASAPPSIDVSNSSNPVPVVPVNVDSLHDSLGDHRFSSSISAGGAAASGGDIMDHNMDLDHLSDHAQSDLGHFSDHSPSYLDNFDDSAPMDSMPQGGSASNFPWLNNSGRTVLPHLSYVSAIQTSLTDFSGARTDVQLPSVTCATDGLALFVFPSTLQKGKHGVNPDYSKWNFVVAQELNAGAVQIKCDCLVPDLAVEMFALSIGGASASSERVGASSVLSDLCKHSHALLDLCNRKLNQDKDNPVDNWWDHADQRAALMLYAARAASFAEDEFEWDILDGSQDASPMCRRLPYKASTTVFEVLMDPEVRSRRHRYLASPHQGRLVTRNGQGTYLCVSCERHGRTCDCTTIVRGMLDDEKVFRKLNTDVKVHANGLSLEIRGKSTTPITPVPHPNVLLDHIDNDTLPDEAWHEAMSDRFGYSLLPHTLPRAVSPCRWPPSLCTYFSRRLSSNCSLHQNLPKP